MDEQSVNEADTKLNLMIPQCPQSILFLDLQFL